MTDDFVPIDLLFEEDKKEVKHISKASTKKIKLMIAIYIIYIVINTEAFIHHVLKYIPNAVKPNENVTTGLGVMVQGVIMVSLYVALDTLIINDWVL